jgi:hypothetical protein
VFIVNFIVTNFFLLLYLTSEEYGEIALMLTVSIRLMLIHPPGDTSLLSVDKCRGTLCDFFCALTVRFFGAFRTALHVVVAQPSGLN